MESSGSFSIDYQETISYNINAHTDQRVFLKKIIWVFILFSATFLFASTSLDPFLDAQMKMEEKLLDQNLSNERKVKIQDEQHHEYQRFFLEYAAAKEKHLKEPDPYRTQISKLKLRLNSNRHRGNKKAVLRDEARLQTLYLRSSIRRVLNKVLYATNNKSKAFYEDKVDEILLKEFEKFTPIKSDPYLTYINNDDNSTMVRSIKEAVKSYYLMEAVAKTFSSELVDNRMAIYRTARLSNAKLFALANQLNASALGDRLNPYLATVSLDVARLVLILLIILVILLIQKVIQLFVNMTLKHYKLKEEDVEYIHTKITRIFNVIVSLFIIQVILVVFFGIDRESILISKIFAVIYIVLVTLLLYRSGNILVHFKIEHIQKNRLLKKEVVNLVIKTLNALLLLAAFIAILWVLGVDLTAVLSGLGIGGFAVAFAAKDSIANIFGSISILAGDLFDQGDWIEVDNMDGTVVEIGLRATTIRTFDNALISIPNFKLVNEGIRNWSRRSIGRRIKMKIGVTYESDFEDIKKAVEDIRQMLLEHPGIANERTTFRSYYRQAKIISSEDYKGVKRTTLVYMDEFADSSINILVYCFSRSVVWQEWLAVKEEVMYKIAEILKKHDLDFAYPAMTIHMANDEEKE